MSWMLCFCCNGLLLRPSKTHAALWLLYHAVDEGVRLGEVDENGERVTWDGVYHHKTYVKPLGMIGVHGSGLIRKDHRFRHYHSLNLFQRTGHFRFALFCLGNLDERAEIWRSPPI